MIAEYTCLFGISTKVDGLIPGDAELANAKDHSFLIFCSKNGRTFWFFFSKMDKTYRVPDIPRFSKHDAEDQMRKYAHVPVTKTVTFGDIIKTRVTYTLAPLEEAFFKTWTWGRFVTLGDSTHKVRRKDYPADLSVPKTISDDPQPWPGRKCSNRVRCSPFQQPEAIDKQCQLYVALTQRSQALAPGLPTNP